MIEVIQYKLINKNSLIGTFSIKIPKWGNLIIHDMAHFQKENKKWITFPSKQFEVQGNKKYVPYIQFEDKTIMESFQKKVLEALEEFRKGL